MKLKWHNKLILITAVFYLFSCGKSTKIKGVVYSPNGVPLSNQVVRVAMYKSGDKPVSEITAALTDDRGKFELNFRIRKNRSYGIECYGDSGYYSMEKFKSSPGEWVVINLKP